MSKEQLLYEREKIILDYLQGVLLRLTTSPDAASEAELALATKEIDVQAINVKLAKLEVRGKRIADPRCPHCKSGDVSETEILYDCDNCGYSW